MEIGRRSSLSSLVLEKISEVGEITLNVLFPQNRAEGRLWRKILGLSTGYEFSRSSFSFILSQLGKEGLIKRTGSRKQAIWHITNSGREKVKSRTYVMEKIKPDGVPRLVMYDIPETEKRKRNLVRAELVACGYDQPQKSVWIGYAPLPENFLKSVNELGLGNKIHIVSIHKKGTLNVI